MGDESKTYSAPVQDGLDAFNGVMDLLHRLYPFLSSTEDRLKAGKYTLSQLADTGFILRNLEKRFDDLRKECSKKKDLVSRVLGVAVAKTVAEAGGDEKIKKSMASIRGEISRATPGVTIQAMTPKRGSGEYIAFMTSLGVPKEVIDKGILDARWNGVAELATELTKAGKKLPPGLGKTMPSYTATYTRLPDSPIGGGDDSSGSESE